MTGSRLADTPGRRHSSFAAQAFLRYEISHKVSPFGARLAAPGGPPGACCLDASERPGL